MISGYVHSDKKGRTLIFLGVCRENVNRLTNGKPILATPEHHGIPANVEVMIFFGETEAELMCQLRNAGIDTSPAENRG